MKPVYYASSECGFSRKDISRAALQVVDGLQQAGFAAYLVGGCVRDLLMDYDPKDFDVTTDASPEEIHSLFKRSRIIGRRFRLVHVRFGREVIEVATFRANPGADQPKKNRWLPWKKVTSNSGRILDDNVYGTIEDDAIRRDFTVNALYYDPAQEQVIDFLGGVDDLDNNVLRIIGEAEKRFSEDPVRMLRVLRFKAKLGLEPDAELTKNISKYSRLISGVPAARLFDEVLKMFHHAHGVNSWHELQQAGLAKYLFPQTTFVIEEEGGDKWETLLLHALENTDRRISQNKPVIPAFLYAVLLWRPFSVQLEELKGTKMSLNELTWQAGDLVFARQCKQVAVPKRVSAPAIEVWGMQSVLQARRPKSIRSTLENRRFRAAYDFLLLRNKIGEVDDELVDWWTRIQDVEENIREEMIDALRKNPAIETDDKPRKRRSRSRKKKNTGADRVAPEADKNSPNIS